MGYVQFNPSTNTIDYWNDSPMYNTALQSNIYYVPFSYNTTDYSYTNSVPGVFNINDFTKIVNITDSEYINRQTNGKLVMKYLRNLLTKTQFNTVCSDAVFFNAMWQYEHGFGDSTNPTGSIQAWLTNIFPTKSYYNNIPTTGSNQGSTIQQSLLAILNNF